MKKLLIILLVIMLLIGSGALLFRHFVTDRIMDRDGMENPEYSRSGRNAYQNTSDLILENIQEEHYGIV